MNNKKATSLFGTPLLMLTVFVIIVILFLFFFSFFRIEKNHAEFTLEKAENTVADNQFLLGLLRSKTNYENADLSELLAIYQMNKNQDLRTKIISHVNELMLRMYKEKVCWELAFEDIVIEEKSGCIKLDEDKKIEAEAYIPGFNYQNFKVRFTTTK